MSTLKFELSDGDKAMLLEAIRDINHEHIMKAIEQIRIESTLPEILYKEDLKKYLKIGENKASYLFNHEPDLNVSRKLGEGSPRIHRADLISWLFGDEERAETFDLNKWDRIS